MVETVWLVRHGMRMDAEDPHWKETAPRPHDPPLSPTGIEQAHKTGDFLKSQGIRLVFSSPFLRTVQTADAIAGKLNLRTKLESGFCEWLNPLWFPEMPELLSLEEMTGRFASVDADYRSRTIPVYPEKDESHQVFRRVAQTLEVILRAHDGSILIVGHGASVWQAGRFLVNPPTGIRGETCAVNKFQRQDGKWGLELATTEHLEAAKPRGAGWQGIQGA